ncbi:MAG: cobalamin-binding protein [Gammaproteobacteria bacterium]|nr:cobalamin-binding protein [Gammaproteobacteria bacterium]MBU1979060.1 cobalamin-binding protein [Gammaproteobacteria bacterium]
MMAGWHPSAILLLLLAATAVVAAPLKLVDDAGRVVVINLPAERIVALSPHVTEMAFATGAGNKLVGVSSFSDYPAAAKHIPHIGDGGKVDAEHLLALKPDLIIGWHSGNSAADIATLERLGIPIFLTEPRRLDDIPRLLETIGRLAGTERVATSAAENFRAGVAELKRRYAGRRPVRVFYEIWHEPLMTVNSEHLISDVIRLCGGRNIFAGVSSLTPSVAVESVLAEDPEAIIASGALYAERGPLENWRRYPRLAAVRRGYVFFIHPDLIQRQTPRILQGAQQMCEQIEQVRKREARKN